MKLTSQTLKLTSQTLLRTSVSKPPVRLSGVFLDSSGATKGLTVLRVAGNEVPQNVSKANLEWFPRNVTTDSGRPVGTLDPFFWQDFGRVYSEGEQSVDWTGGVMTCLVALNEIVLPEEQCWQKERARIAEPESLIDKPVRLSGGEEIGVILDELSYMPYGDKTVYPLLKLRRSEADRQRPKTIRNGAMVFASDDSMVGVIVASFGEGLFYSVSPIGDIMTWHSLSFLPSWAFMKRENQLGTEHQIEFQSEPLPSSSWRIQKLMGA